MQPRIPIHWHRIACVAVAATVALLGNVWMASAQPAEVKLSLLGQWPEMPPTWGVLVKVAGDHAYVAAQGRFVVLDLANPARPTLAGYCDLPRRDHVQGVEVTGHYALVATLPESGMFEEPGYLQVVDIADPAHPKWVASRRFPTWCKGVGVSGTLAYIAAKEGGLYILDVSDPLNLRQVARLPLQGRAMCVRVVGDRAYVGEGVGGGVGCCEGWQGYLEIVDVSTPSAPRVLGGCDTVGAYVHALDVAGRFVYVGNTTKGFAGGLEIIDASDPSNPLVVGSVPDNSYVRAVQAAGPYVYATSDGQGLLVIDARNPSAPVVLGTCPAGHAGGDSHGVQVSGHHAYVTYGADFLGVIDVGDPTAPALAGTYEFQAYIADVCVQGPYAYVSTWSFIDPGLRVFDVSDPTRPREVGRHATAVGVSGSDVHVAGGLACVTGESNWPPDFWELLDVQTPSRPVLLHHEDTAVASVRVQLVGVRLYVMQQAGDEPVSYPLQVLDLADPTSPVLSGECTVGTESGDRPDFSVQGAYAYVALDSVGVVIVDLTIPSDPRPVATVPARDSNSIEVVGHHAYVGRDHVWDDDAQAYCARLQILDVSDPVHPVKVGACNIPGEARVVDLSLAEDYAVLALAGYGLQGLWVIDVRIPAQPKLVGRYVSESDPVAVHAVGNRIYLADDRGLSVLGMSLADPLKLNPPVLSATTLTLTWNGRPGIKLQKTTSLTVPNWQDVPGSDGVSAIELPRDAAAVFFRLIQP